MRLKTWMAACAIGILSTSCGSTETETPESKPTGKNETTITDWDNYQYEVPVIFHVLYADRNEETQYVSHTRLKSILESVNKLYAGKIQGSPNMNVTFKLAQTNEKGKTLDTPGVEYIKWTGTYPMDYTSFMSNNEGKYTQYLWNPNQYINVMLYQFSASNSDYTTLGVSHMPYTTTGNNPLAGLTQIEETTLEKDNLLYPYCVSINSLFINEESTDQYYNPQDIVVTIAHELGHYLGLYHAFSEDDDEGTLDSCQDTDYCEDTPSYNRTEYEDYYSRVVSGKEGIAQNKWFATLVKRTNCSNQSFTSTNIMDYEISYANQFTADQRTRVRHVLMYSPLIPGPKRNSRAASASAPKGTIDLPIRVIR